MTAVTTIRAPRQDNRREQLRDTAAALFGKRGFYATSMRELAQSVGMLPGSVYYHFPSKEDLLVAVYEEGVRRIAARVDAATAPFSDPWRALEAACIAHLETLLEANHYAQVVVRVLPQDAPGVSQRLIRLRDSYEKRFRDLIRALDTRGDGTERYLRLLLLGALNWTQFWYRDGKDSPRTIARRFLALLRRELRRNPV